MTYFHCLAAHWNEPENQKSDEQYTYENTDENPASLHQLFIRIVLYRFHFDIFTFQIHIQIIDYIFLSILKTSR